MAIVIAVVCALSALPLQSVVSFGGVLGVFSGMAAWWLIGFVAVLPYALCVFPWDSPIDGFSRRP